MEWNIEFEPEAIANLEKLTKTARDRVANKIRWLAINLEQIVPEPLTRKFIRVFQVKSR